MSFSWRNCGGVGEGVENWKTESCVYNKTSTTCSQHLLGNLHALVCSHQIRRMLWYFCSGSAAIRTVYLHFLNLFPREQINTSQVIIQSLKGRCCHLCDKIVLLKRNFAGLKHSFSCSSFPRKQWAFCKRAFFTTISSGVCCAGSAPLHWAVLLTHRVPGQGESQLPAQEKAERGVGTTRSLSPLEEAVGRRMLPERKLTRLSLAGSPRWRLPPS